MNAEFSAVSEWLVSAVLNGTGQGMLVVLLLAAFFKLFRNLNAATRHALDLIALVLLVFLPLAHFYVGATIPARSEVELPSSAPIQIEEIAPLAVAIDPSRAVSEEAPAEWIP